MGHKIHVLLRIVADEAQRIRLCRGDDLFLKEAERRVVPPLSIVRFKLLRGSDGGIALLEEGGILRRQPVAEGAAHKLAENAVEIIVYIIRRAFFPVKAIFLRGVAGLRIRLGIIGFRESGDLFVGVLHHSAVFHVKINADPLLSEEKISVLFSGDDHVVEGAAVSVFPGDPALVKVVGNITHAAFAGTEGIRILVIGESAGLPGVHGGKKFIFKEIPGGLEAAFKQLFELIRRQDGNALLRHGLGHFASRHLIQVVCDIGFQKLVPPTLQKVGDDPAPKEFEGAGRGSGIFRGIVGAIHGIEGGQFSQFLPLHQFHPGGSGAQGDGIAVWPENGRLPLKAVVLDKIEGAGAVALIHKAVVEERGRIMSGVAPAYDEVFPRLLVVRGDLAQAFAFFQAGKDLLLHKAVVGGKRVGKRRFKLALIQKHIRRVVPVLHQVGRGNAGKVDEAVLPQGIHPVIEIHRGETRRFKERAVPFFGKGVFPLIKEDGRQLRALGEHSQRQGRRQHQRRQNEGENGTEGLFHTLAPFKNRGG